MKRLVLIGFLAFSVPVSSQEKKTADPPPSDKIFKTLKEVKDLDFRNQTLSKIAESLSEMTSVPFEIDPTLIVPVMQGLALEQTITMRSSKASLGGALHHALAPYGMTWVVLTDRVVLTTQERSVPLQMQQKIVRDIEGTLKKALDEIARQFGLSIVLDPQSAKEGETAITASLNGTSLEATINVLAANAGLQVVRLDNTLYVTSPEKAKRMPKRLSTMPPAPQPQVGGALIGVGVGMIGAIGGNVIGVMGGNIGFGGFAGAAGGVPPAPVDPNDEKPAEKPKKDTPDDRSMSSRLRILQLAMAAAPVPEKPAKNEDEPIAQKLRRELNAPVTLELNATPLPQAVALLKEKTGVDFVLDRAILDNYFNERTGQGNGCDGAMVTAKLNKTVLRRGLKNLLSEHDLGYVILGEQVMITTQAMVTTRQLRQNVTVDADKVSVSDALKKLARETAINLVMDSRVGKEGQEKVSLQLEDVPLETAVKLLAEQAGLKVVFVDNVLFVTSKQRALEMREDPDFKPRPAPTDPFTVPGGGAFPGGGGPMVPPMGIPGKVVPPNVPPDGNAEAPAKEKR